MQVPDTECHKCMMAEMTRNQRMAYRIVHTVRDVFNPPSHFDTIGIMFSQSIRTMQGIPNPTWYDMHRKYWIETGDFKELRRMLRHVRNQSR